MQIISWNVASIRARLPLLLELLNEKQPDIVLLQEIKTQRETFPLSEITRAGYYAYMNGQKGFNGVAILSKTPLTDVITVLPEMETDEQARFIQATDGKNVYISVYVPNGTPPANNISDNSRLEYKIRWMDALNRHLRYLSGMGNTLVLGGDFNVIAEDRDVYNPSVFEGGALMVVPVREQFQMIAKTPLVNTLRTLHFDETIYSFWDFQMGAARRNLGILLDYIFVSPILQKALVESGVYAPYRHKEKPSDHAPVYCILNEL